MAGANKTFKTSPHSVGTWSRVNFCSADSSRVWQAYELAMSVGLICFFGFCDAIFPSEANTIEQRDNVTII